MPQNGYWIECVPVTKNGNEAQEDIDLLYSAMISSIPETKTYAPTPDKAIQKLRDKLAALRHDYCLQGKELPEHDNPIRPPRNISSVRGWISVYVQMNECCKNNIQKT